MTIERTDSQQTTCNATAVIDGQKRQVAAATCSIRPGRGMSFSIDIPADVELGEEDAKAIAEMFGSYLSVELDKAAGLGIPIKQ